MNDNNKMDRVLSRIAVALLVFAGVLTVLVIANYFQLNRVDPVNTELINQLVERLNDDPGDALLRDQIRELDLLARKAYFTNQWQIRTGSYLILISLALFVILYQVMGARRKQYVLANPDAPDDILGIQKNARFGISIVGVILVAVALMLSFISQKRIAHKFDKKDQLVSDESSIPESQQDEMLVQAKPDSTLIESMDSNTTDIAAVEVEEILEAEKEVIVSEPESDNKIVVEPDSKPEVSIVTEVDKWVIPSNNELKKNANSFRGFNGNGLVFQTNVPVKWNGSTGDNILWKVPVPVKSYNSPIVWKDRIFMTGANATSRQVYCFERNAGKLLWTTKIENIPGSPAVVPKTTDDTGLGAPTMTTDGNLVYAIFGTGDLVALNMEGKMIWGKNLGVPQNHYGHSSSLMMYKEKLIVQYDQKSGGQLMAFTARTGDILWSTARKVKVSWASPVLVNYNGTTQIVLAADPGIAAYNPNNGKELWKVDCIFGEVGPSVCYDNNIVYAVNEYAKIAAIDLKQPDKVLWETDEILSDIPSPVAANGLLIMPASYGLIGCYDGLTGELLWEHEFGSNIYASPVVVGDKVYLMDTEGIMHIFSLSRDGYKNIADCPLGEQVVTTPAFSDGRIYVRTNNNLYCIGNK